MIEEDKTNLNVRRISRKNRITRLGIDLAKTVFHVCGAGGGAGGCRPVSPSCPGSGRARKRSQAAGGADRDGERMARCGLRALPVCFRHALPLLEQICMRPGSGQCDRMVVFFPGQ